MRIKSKTLLVGIALFGLAVPLSFASYSLAQTSAANAPLVITRPLAFGAKGADVSALQQFLKNLAYFKYPTITGYYGLVTWKAVAAFQVDNGLESVGSVGPKTRTLIAKLSGATSSSVSTASPAQGAPATAATSTPKTFCASVYCPGNGYSPGFGGGSSGGGGSGGSGGGSTPAPDTTAPTISSTAPINGATVSGSIVFSASASDNVGVVGVQFKLDGSSLGAEDTSAPYSVTWDTTGAIDGTHTLTAVARDAAGNTTTSSAVTVTIENTPVSISGLSSGTPMLYTATTTWTTNEAANSKVLIGTTTAYGTTYADATMLTSHSIVISGLTAGTLYHFRVVSKNAAGNTATSSDQTFTTAAQQTLTLFLTSGASWTVPNDWNSASNTVETIGGGAGGAKASSAGGGTAGGAGGGGAYAKATNVVLTPGNSIVTLIGTGGLTGTSPTAGGDTCFGGGSLVSCTIVGAQGGQAPTGSGLVTGGAGGAAPSSVGSTKYSGGAGGSAVMFSDSSSGGGGAAGPLGAGAAGGSATTNGSAVGGAGGGGADNGSAGGTTSTATGAAGGANGSGVGAGGAGTDGGNSSPPPGNNGTPETTWTQTSDSSVAGSGGGGGAAGTTGGGVTPGAGGNGALYGGGGAGGASNGAGTNYGAGGNGAQGIIVITYTQAATSSSGTGGNATPPAISLLSSGTPLPNSATITWATDQLSNSQVAYGTSVAYGATSTDPTLTATHSVTITGLTINTTYHFKVFSTNTSGKVSSSTDQIFTTPDDGSGSASTAAIQLPHLLDGYAVRPPWQVAGVDYAVGIHSGVTLTPASSLSSNPNLTISGNNISCSGTSSITLDSIDFTGYSFSTSAGGCANVIITNSKFACPPSWSSSASFALIHDQANANYTLKYDEFDGDNCGTWPNDTSDPIAVNNLVFQYNYMHHMPERHVSDTGEGSTLDYRFNLINQPLTQTGAHENFLQWGDGVIGPVTVAFNTTYQGSTPGGEGFQFYTNNPGSISTINFSNNTMVAQLSGGVQTMSNMVHGNCHSTSDCSTTTDVVSGSAINAYNYFDASGAFGAYYSGSMTSTMGWTSFGNIDMTTGFTITPN